MKDGEFKRSTVMALASRAANMCSNPDCLALTSGPSSEDASAVNVGEAAHIFGGKPGAARWDPSMTDEERSDPTNGIWLCRICHKKTDADPIAYPSGLMFEWKRAHETHVLSRLGKASDMRAKVQERLLAAFPEAGYLAEQTILDKPMHWEYKLTAQLLRQFLDPLHMRLRQLSGGFYSLPLKRVRGRESTDWVLDVNANVLNQIQVLSRLVTEGFEQAWGAPGVPGSDLEIYNVCKLLRDACARCIEIEECIRFTKLDEEFSDVSLVLAGMMTPSLEKIFSIQSWLASIFSEEKPHGEHELHLVFVLPPDWDVRLQAAIEKGMKLLRAKS
jgi:hypothetical protein